MGDMWADRKTDETPHNNRSLIYIEYVRGRQLDLRDFESLFVNILM